MDGLDADVLEMMLQAIQEFADRHLPCRPRAAARPRGRVPGRAGPHDVRRGPGHPPAVRARGVRRDGRRQLRRVPGVREDGRHRPRGGDQRARHRPGQRPDRGGRHRGTEEAWLGRLAEEGLLFAYGATEPEAGSDLGALKTTATPVEQDGRVVGYRLNGRKQWISNGGIADAYTILANTPGRAELVRGRAWGRELHPGQPRGQARHPAEQHRRPVPRRRPGRSRRAGRRRRGPGPAAGPAGVRLHAPHGRRLRARGGLVGARPGDRLLDRADPGRRAPLGEAGLHPQADRPSRGPPRGRPRLHRGDRRADRRRRGEPQHRGRHRQVPGHRGRQRRRRGGHPGPRRLRLHAGVHGREDQARRPDHHDLRGHLRDHGDDDRPRPLAGAPEDPRAATTTTGPTPWRPSTAPTPASAPGPPRSPSTPSPRCWSGAAPGA